ncbi:hypothetical protein F4775DRAFT_557507 [Biscogniauxia sp. FL1348]|nr:hypothetical protein F4775DRAFT_557507 [Biscogniauxia sp. FL1348]
MKMKIVGQIHKTRTGGEILSLLSCFSGSPAPETSNNPPRRKSSWSSHGVFVGSAKRGQGLEG